VWELRFDSLPVDGRLLMTDRAKWNTNYQKKYGIMTGPASAGRHRGSDPAPVQAGVPHAGPIGVRAHRSASRRRGRVYVLEANPNPQLAYGEDFAESAEHGGLSYEGLLQTIINNGCVAAGSLGEGRAPAPWSAESGQGAMRRRMDMASVPDLPVP